MPFLYKSVSSSFSLLTFWVCNFLAKNIGTKAARKVLIKLTINLINRVHRLIESLWADIKVKKITNYTIHQYFFVYCRGIIGPAISYYNKQLPNSDQL